MKLISNLFKKKKETPIVTYRVKKVDCSINNEIHQKLIKEMSEVKQ